MIGRRSHDDAQSFDEAWSGRTPRDAHIAELVRFAENLCEAAVVEPRAAFRDSLREQLMIEAATTLEVLPAATPVPVTSGAGQRGVRRRAAVITAALVASAGTVGLVGSSASAVPGEMLYPVKRGMENVQLALHRDDASRGEFQLARASERLAEARTLAVGDTSDQHQVSDLLADFTTTANDAWVSMDDAFTSDPSTGTMQSVSEFAQSAALELTSLKTSLPDDATPSFSDATDVVLAMTAGASKLCPTCSEVDLGNLVSAVTADVAPAPAASAKPSKAPATTKAPVAITPTFPSAAVPTVPPAVPTLPAKTPSLSTITDPLLGGLLGDEEQVGLIPGLLGGLLGTTPK